MTNFLVSFDEFGRLLVPKKIRKAFSTNKFALRVENEEIRLIPIRTWEEFFGSIPELSVKLLKRLRREEAEHG